jgi:hypothetical protein
MFQNRFRVAAADIPFHGPVFPFPIGFFREVISKLSFRPISASGPRFQSSEYGSIPVADPGATGAAENLKRQ